MYLSPHVDFDPSYDPETDCKFDTFSSGSCMSTVTKTSRYVHIQVKGSPTHLNVKPNPFPTDTYTDFYIKKIRFPQVSTKKSMLQGYFRLHVSSDINADAYMCTRTI